MDFQRVKLIQIKILIFIPGPDENIKSFYFDYVGKLELLQNVKVA